MRNFLSVCAALLLAVSASAQLTLLVDYTQDSNNFFNTQAKKDAFQAAANYVAGFVSPTALAAITSAGINHYTAIISNPGTGGTTNFADTSVAANTLLVYAGGRDLTGVGSGVLAIAGPAGFSISGTQSFIDTVQFRGNGSFHMTSVGSVSFSTTFSFAFDTDVTTKESFPGQADFFSVAIHELGHVLGIGTNASWDALASVTHTFLGAASAAANGGVAPSLTSDDGHWASGTSSTVFGTATLQDTSLSPTISFDQRKFYTTLDVAGLQDIGFTAVPEPADYALVFGMAALAWCGYRRRLRAA